MKFTVAWAEVLKENHLLKGIVGILSLTTIVLSITAARIALSPPLIVERACYSRVLPNASPQATPSEIEAFVKQALHERFDSDAVVTSGYLTIDEEGFRKEEQESLRAKGMAQIVIVRSIKIDGTRVTVDSDRLISVGPVRSAFSFPLSLTLSTVNRSSSNPYGLVLTKVSNPKEEGRKQ